MSTEPKAVQRIRVRKCGARLPVPNDDRCGGALGAATCDTTFVCADEKGHDGPHREVGSVQMDNVTARDFTITWVDAGRRSLRQRNSQDPLAATSASKVARPLFPEGWTARADAAALAK